MWNSILPRVTAFKDARNEFMFPAIASDIEMWSIPVTALSTAMVALRCTPKTLWTSQSRERCCHCPVDRRSAKRARSPEALDGCRSCIVTLVTDDVATAFHHAVDAGAFVESAPTYNPKYNITHCFLRDPDGHRIEIQCFHDPAWPGYKPRGAP